MASDVNPIGKSAHPTTSLPLPGTEQYADLSQFPTAPPLPFRRTIRRRELHQIVPLAETTIYEMEQHGEFPRRFRLTPRCVVWDLEEVEAWIEARKQASRSGQTGSPSGPDVRLRKRRPVLLGPTSQPDKPDRPDMGE